jgi:hypothetical protein
MEESLRDDSLPHPAGQRRRIPLHVVAGVILGIGLSFYLARRYFRDPLPELTPERLRQATAKWQSDGPQDYHVEVEVQSREPERYAVEVRGGNPQQAWRNGRPLKQSRVFDTWSIPGMFTTIGDDLDRAHRAGQSGSNLTLRGQFDEQTGAPLSYRRIEWGSDLEVSWRITKLEAIESDGSRHSLLDQAD